MKLLLDTHVWLWSILEPDRITARVARQLEHADNELWLSPVSLWEALMLSRKKRIALNPDPQTWIREKLAEVPCRQAPLTFDVALATRALDLSHNDPADRFLAATALVYGLTLVTSDERMFRSKQLKVLKNV